MTRKLYSKRKKLTLCVLKYRKTDRNKRAVNIIVAGVGATYVELASHWSVATV